jgi:hypothetical protein
VDENVNVPPSAVPVIPALKFWKSRPGMPPSVGARGAAATVPEWLVVVVEKVARDGLEVAANPEAVLGVTVAAIP